MEQADAVAYTEKCMNGEPAPCTSSCPYRLDIRALMGKTSKGKWNSAYKALRTAVLFPSIIGTLCPAHCQNECLRTQTGDEPVCVRMIEEACVRFASSKKPDNYVIPPKTQRVAIVGAGVAGLSAALCLAQKKYPVIVFDKNNGWGGSLRTHPRFEDFDADIALQFSTTETEFRFDATVVSLEDLAEFDLIYIATGEGGNDFGLLSSWEPKLLTTSEPKVFLGGALTGAGAADAAATGALGDAGLASAIMQGKSFSKTAEVFLQTGRAAETIENVSDGVCRIDCSAEPSMPRVIPANPDGYTEEEAISESQRCLQCDCDMCIDSCEMLGSFRKKPKKIALAVYADTKATPPYSTHTLTRQAYSCNMCGHCKTVCPEDVDIGALLQTSRAARTEEAHYPEAIHDFWLREMDYMTGEASFFTAPGDAPGYIFFPGCQLGANNPEYVLKAYEFLSNNFGAGIYQHCCGAPAYWAGDSKRLEVNIEHIRSTRNEFGNPRYVFACATCESMFDKFLPEIERISLYELLAASTDITPKHIFDKASVFDPCNARYLPETELAVRVLAERSGAALRELPEKNRCCGYGGHTHLANPKLFDVVTANRAKMGDHPYIVYCVNCLEIFQSRGKESAHILDVVFGLPQAASNPKIDKKHKNAMKVKEKLGKDITGAGFSVQSNEWVALELVIDDSLAESIDRKLISLDDVREAIWLAETTGDKFIDETDGFCQCCMEKQVLTYWVQYKKTESGAFEVYGAYYHRMRISKEDA